MTAFKGVEDMAGAESNLQILLSQVGLDVTILNKGNIAIIAFFRFQNRQSFGFGFQSQNIAVEMIHTRNIVGR